MYKSLQKNVDLGKSKSLTQGSFLIVNKSGVIRIE